MNKTKKTNRRRSLKKGGGEDDTNINKNENVQEYAKIIKEIGNEAPDDDTEENKLEILKIIWDELLKKNLFRKEHVDAVKRILELLVNYKGRKYGFAHVLEYVSGSKMDSIECIDYLEKKNLWLSEKINIGPIENSSIGEATKKILGKEGDPDGRRNKKRRRWMLKQIGMRGGGNKTQKKRRRNKKKSKSRRTKKN
jgi:hypothetical protein